MALTKANADLVDALKMITFLAKKLGEREKTPGPGPPYSRPSNTHYCFTCGYRSSHSSLKCTTPGPGYQNAATKVNTMGGSTKNKPQWHRHGSNISSMQLSNYAPLLDLNIHATAVADSGATGNFICVNTHCNNKVKVNNGTIVGTPDGNTIQATHACAHSAT